MKEPTKKNRFLITIPKHIRNILSDSEIEHIHRNATFSKYVKFHSYKRKYQNSCVTY